MVTVKTTFSLLSKDRYLRNDEKYQVLATHKSDNIFSTPVEKNITLSEVLEEDYSLFQYESGKEYKGIPTGKTYIDEDGDIVDYQLVTLEDHPGRLKYVANHNNILLSSLRLAKSPALMFDDLDLSEYVFSNGFYIFKVKQGWEQKFVLYLLRSKKVKRLLDNNLYRGIGISSYKVEDLLKCEIKKLSIKQQKEALSHIYPIEKQIKELKMSLHKPQEIIDSYFCREFGINMESLLDIDSQKTINLNLSNLHQKNVNVRFSYRWNKAVAIQEEIISSVECCKKLGGYIINTKNGWSPDCDETQSAHRVLGIDSIKKDGTISYDNVKYSDETKKNIDAYIIKNDDFFVSRGNTTELVALAGVASVSDEDPITIFPDLMIRVTFDKSINKTYMAYVFNSIIGRLYFKYVTKGKNQTMVKVSPQELNDFYVPLPDYNEQQRIVENIQSEIAKQNEIKTQIAELRDQIDSIIEEAFTKGDE